MRNPAGVGRLTNRAGGDLTVSQTDLLFFNDFVDKDVTEVPQDLANNYRTYREKKNAEIAEKERVNIVKRRNQPLTTDSEVAATPPLSLDREARYKNLVSNIDTPLPPNGPAPVTSLARTFERKRKIFIDSKHRNKILYPDASDFVISWGRTFQNVKSMKLVSLEFPNVVQAVGPSNNGLRWRNQEDLDLLQPYPVYTKNVRPGSYPLTALGEEMSNILQLVRRRGGNPSAPRHQFIIETDIDTDFVSFTSIIANLTEPSPVQTIAGSSRITFTQKNHGYISGERIHILGVMGFVGGIMAYDINGAFNITRVNDDVFTYDTQTIAITSARGGGTLVSTGRESPFQFLFGEYPNPIAELIGFPVENSSVTIPVSHPLTTVVRDIVQIIPGSPFTQIVSPAHGLLPKDKVFLHNTFVTPSIYESERHKGAFEVLAVPSPDVFLIKYSTERVSDITNAFVGTQILEMYYPGHGFNRIVNIEQIGENKILITTLFDHGFDTKSHVKISETNSQPSVDGYYRVTPVESDSFIISNPSGQVPLMLSVAGHRGILASDYNFRLYNVRPFGGFTATDLNNTPLKVRDVIDADNFTFSNTYGYSQVWEKGGGDGVRINSKLHGWAGTQSNFLNGVLYRPVKLAGDNYAFMCIPGLNSDSITTTGPVKDIFAKIFITLNPGLVIFNDFDSSPIDFITPVPRIDELRFTIRSPDDDLIAFNGLDYSFGLELVEETQADLGIERKSERLAPPIVKPVKVLRGSE